jgi:uncharacterized protein (DUF58 family)
MLTARGRQTIALGLIAGVFGRILGIPELFGLAAAVVVVVLGALVSVRRAKGDVTVSARAVPPVVNAGEPALLELTIEERGVTGRFSTPIVLVLHDSQGQASCQPARIIVPRLGRGDRAHASFVLSTERRGPIDAGAYEAVVSDPLGLARRCLAVSRSARCVVLPRIEPLATVVPKSAGRVAAASTRSAAERLVTGNSMLRRYAQGDDLRSVHWRTTARVGELMVRDGGDREDPGRIATTVLLDAGDEITPLDEIDRAVEVAASVLAAAAAASKAGICVAYRALTTTHVDTGTKQGHEGLEKALVALAGVSAAPGSPAERFTAAVGCLGPPAADEVLVVVGAFGDCPPERGVLENLAHEYSTVVLVLVGPAASAVRYHGDLVSRADLDRELPRILETGPSSPRERGGMSGTGVFTVRLPLDGSLAAEWNLDVEGQDTATDLSGRPAVVRGISR